MDPSAIRRLLLDLLATRDAADGARLAVLDDDDWALLDEMAVQHRLQPLLHVRCRHRSDIPEPIAGRWHQALRQSAIEALVMRADLVDCCALLEANGFRPIALKGAYLARHAYPAEAQRPLRDLDLLLDPETVLAGFRLLLDNGYRLLSSPDLPLEQLVDADKEMPALAAPRGSCIELHQRLSMPDERFDHAIPPGDPEGFRQRAIVVEGITYPSPGDMLAHLIIHGVYGHSLNCGPLVIDDIVALVRSHEIDHELFWAQARGQGWQEGAALLFALARRYHGTEAVPPLPPDVQPPPDSVLAAAPDLLLQDLVTRRSAGLLATLRARGPGHLIRRFTTRRERSRPVDDALDLQRPDETSGRGLGRLRHTLVDLADAGVRRQSRDLATLSRWLGTGN